MGININEIVAGIEGNVQSVEVKPSYSKPLRLRWPFFRGAEKLLSHGECLESFETFVAKRFHEAIIVEQRVGNDFTPKEAVYLTVYI